LRKNEQDRTGWNRKITEISLSTVDLLVLTSLDELVLILFAKQLTLMRRSIVLRLLLEFVFFGVIFP
jgi:hypothetical protein